MHVIFLYRYDIFFYISTMRISGCYGMLWPYAICFQAKAMTSSEVQLSRQGSTGALVHQVRPT